MPNVKTAGDLRLESYLAEHGHEFEYEPDCQAHFGVRCSPDYLVTRRGGVAVVEVKQFETSRVRDTLEQHQGRAIFVAPRDEYGTTRQQLKDAASKLKPLGGMGVPLVAVLSNPLGADVQLDYDGTVFAMFGNPKVSFTKNTTTGETGRGSAF